MPAEPHPEAAPAPGPRARAVLLLACVVHAALALASFAGVVHIWHVHCESFGCIGVGLLWMLWIAVLYLPALVIGTILATRRSLPTNARPFVRIGHFAIVALGLGLAAYWLWWRLRTVGW